MRTVSHESAIASGFGLCVALRYDAPSGFRLCRLCSMRLAAEAGIRDWLRALCGPSRRRSLRYSRLLPLLPLGPWKSLMVAQASGGDIGVVVDEFESPLLYLLLLWQRPNACRRSSGTSASQHCGGYKVCSSGIPLLRLPVMSSVSCYFRRPKGAALLPPGVGLPAVVVKWASRQLLPKGGALYVFSDNCQPCTGCHPSLHWGPAQYHVRGTDSMGTSSHSPSSGEPLLSSGEQAKSAPQSAASFPLLGTQTVAPAVRQGGNGVVVDKVVYTQTASKGHQRSCGVDSLS